MCSMGTLVHCMAFVARVNLLLDLFGMNMRECWTNLESHGQCHTEGSGAPVDNTSSLLISICIYVH